MIEGEVVKEKLHKNTIPPGNKLSSKMMEMCSTLAKLTATTTTLPSEISPSSKPASPLRINCTVAFVPKWLKTAHKRTYSLTALSYSISKECLELGENTRDCIGQSYVLHEEVEDPERTASMHSTVGACNEYSQKTLYTPPPYNGLSSELMKKLMELGM